jgi:hypothetical protein
MTRTPVIWAMPISWTNSPSTTIGTSMLDSDIRRRDLFFREYPLQIVYCSREWA